MKAVKIIIGVLIIASILIQLPKTIDSLSLFNSSSSRDVTAIFGTLVGKILMLIIGILLLRSGLKTKTIEKKEDK
jgi:hypothetical protein